MTLTIGKPNGNITPIVFTNEDSRTYTLFLLSWLTGEERQASIKRKTQVAENYFKRMTNG